MSKTGHLVVSDASLGLGGDCPELFQTLPYPPVNLEM